MTTLTAPRIVAGFKAVSELLADLEWHDHLELIATIRGTGLAERTAVNMLAEARKLAMYKVENRAVYPDRYRFYYRAAR